MDLIYWEQFIWNLQPYMRILGAVAVFVCVLAWMTDFRAMLFFRRRTRPLSLPKVFFWQSRWFFLIAALCLGLYQLGFWARPVLQSQIQAPLARGVFVLDLSRSMLAQESSGTRLDWAKKEIQKRIQAEGQRPWALVGYAAEVVGLCPPTIDSEALGQRLKAANPNLIRQGSRPDLALDWVSRNFDSGTRVVWLTDGEDFSGRIQQVLGSKAQKLQLEIVPVGSTKPSFVPDPDGSPHRNRKGELVYSRMDSSSLRKFSQSLGQKGTLSTPKEAPKAVVDPLKLLALALILASIFVFFPLGSRLAPWKPSERDMN